MVVTYADKTLLESATFLALGVGETKVILGTPPESLTFLLNLIKVEGNGNKMAYSAETIDDKTVKLNCTNWSNPLGTTLTVPIEVGIFKGRKLFLLPFISKAGSVGDYHIVTLTFYLGSEA